MHIEHFVITRFNMGVYNAPDEDRGPELKRASKILRWDRVEADPDKWTAARLQLFKRFTIPSMRCQLNKNFKWLIIVDSRTSPQLRQELDAALRDVPHILHAAPGVVDIVNADQLLAPYLTGIPDVLITSRVDSDDGVFHSYVKAIQAAVAAGVRGVIDFKVGMHYDIRSGRVGLHQFQLSSAFISYAIDVPGLLTGLHTCFEFTHHTMVKTYGVHKVHCNLPAALIVLHKNNLNNVMKGRPCRKDWLQTLFGIAR